MWETIRHFSTFRDISNDRSGWYGYDVGVPRWNSSLMNIVGTKPILELVIACVEQPVLTRIALIIIWLIAIIMVLWIARRSRVSQVNKNGLVASGALQRTRNPPVKRECPDASRLGTAHTDPPSGRYVLGRVIGLAKGTEVKATSTKYYKDTTDTNDEISTSELKSPSHDMVPPEGFAQLGGVDRRPTYDLAALKNAECVNFNQVESEMKHKISSNDDPNLEKSFINGLTPDDIHALLQAMDSNKYSRIVAMAKQKMPQRTDQAAEADATKTGDTVEVLSKALELQQMRAKECQKDTEVYKQREDRIQAALAEERARNDEMSCGKKYLLSDTGIRTSKASKAITDLTGI